MAIHLDDSIKAARFFENKKIRCFKQFLGIPVPDLPFPNVNDTPTMLDRIR